MTITICLDEKDWIWLARGFYYENISSGWKEASRKVVEAAEQGKAIFPISIRHFDETLRNRNQERRVRLARFIMKVSRGNTISPGPEIIDFEIQDACLRALGLTGYKMKNFAISAGIPHMIGTGQPYLDFKRPVSEEIRQAADSYLRDVLQSPDSLLTLLESVEGNTELDAYLKTRRKLDLSAAKKLEELRKSKWVVVKDRKVRYELELLLYLRNPIALKVGQFMVALGVEDPRAATPFLRSREKILTFFKSIPTAYCLFLLTFERDMLEDRPIEPNDLSDIMGLSVAIPYADIVVTEKMWQTMAIQRKLDKLYNTTILNSGLELIPFL